MCDTERVPQPELTLTPAPSALVSQQTLHGAAIRHDHVTARNGRHCVVIVHCLEGREKDVL